MCYLVEKIIGHLDLVLGCKNVFEWNQTNHCYSDEKSKCLGPTADPNAFGIKSQSKFVPLLDIKFFEDVYEMMIKCINTISG